MHSLITPERPAIKLSEVSKVYKLYGSQRQQLADALKLNRFTFGPKEPIKEYVALDNVSLEVARGHRIGIVGRNGAGKTTLLKLICGNFVPSSGHIEVNGTVQALMNLGLGFHPEYTGRENVESSLLYNGLARASYDEALAGIVEFCELGEFLDQPFKTYSLGMQARLMFAAATAIQPDILIVDEVLGAGDAYFVAKSKARVEQMVSSGCTMLLVSHSMQQVLELCSEAIWLDQGRIRMQGDSFSVVKAYEAHLHGPISQITVPAFIRSTDGGLEALAGKVDIEQGENIRPALVLPDSVLLQEPEFLPHSNELQLPGDRTSGFRFEAPGGISRWESELGLKVCGFSIITEQGESNTLVVMRPAKICITLVSEVDSVFSCRYGVALHDMSGNCLTRIFSPCDEFSLEKGGVRQVDVLLNPCQIGPGEYTLGISVLEYGPIEKLNSARRYDLLSRSFSIRVELPDSLGALGSTFFHSAEWNFLSN